MSDAITFAERELRQAQNEQAAIEQRVNSVILMVEDQINTAALMTGDVSDIARKDGLEAIRDIIKEEIFWKPLADAEDRARDAEGRLARLVEEDERRAYQAAVL